LGGGGGWGGGARAPPATSLHLYVRDTETDTLFLAFADPYADVSYGDRIEIKGTLKLPESFDTDTGRVFDYAGYLKARGVSEVLYRAKIEVLAHGEGNGVLLKLFTLKRGFMDALERAIPEPAAGLGEGLLLGVKRALGEDLEETFRTVGIIHIVVLSGYNIMIVADSVMRFLALFFLPRTRLIIGILTIVLFAILVGLSATVVRASMMAVLVLIARATGRQYAVLRALALAGTVMLVINPYLLVYDPGFQLSFLATLGLILLSPELEIRMPRIPSTLGIRGYLATTLGTQLFVLPVLLYSMGTLSFVSVLANVLVLPMVPIAMFLTFITGIVATIIAPLGIFVGFIAHLSLSYIIKIAELLSTIPFAAVTIPAFPWWGIVIMYAFIIWLTLWLKERNALSSDNTIPVNRSTAFVASNDYEGWVIEEEKETPPGTRSVPGGVKDDFPFR
jgi:competence protein ComEC